MKDFPKYSELNRPDETGLPLAWGLWGKEDQLGTLNHITEAKVQEAAGLIKKGRRFNLDLPLHIPYGVIREEPMVVARQAARQTIFGRERGAYLVRDDKLDEFYLQSSSQWDGLTHMGDAAHGFYNGVQPEQVTGLEGTKNGIENLAEFGVVSRGVLADLVRFFKKTGREWDVMAGQVASAEDLDNCLKDQGVSLEPGDILMVRMGWVGAMLNAPDTDSRDALMRPWHFSGLSGGEDMWAYLWDNKVAALAADTVTVESWPMKPEGATMHRAIPRLGLTIGEMFDFEALAEDCEAEKNYLSFFSSSPLNVRGGVGSPPNAMAIR